MSGLHFTVIAAGPSLVIYLRGELDMGSTEQLSFVASAVLNDRDAHRVELDLADVTFIDMAGIHALQKVRNDARQKGCDLYLRALSPQVQRTIWLSGMSELFPAAGRPRLRTVDGSRAHDVDFRSWDLHPESDGVTLLFAQVAEALARSTAALLDDDPDLGQVVIDGDYAIDEATKEIESAVWHRLRHDPPNWPELRGAIGLLLILPELERSADLAEHIAQRALTGIGAQMTPTSRGIVQRMSEVAMSLWARTATAYAEGTVDCDDLEEADDGLDVLHERLTNEVARGRMDAALAAQVTLLSRFYERLGDHAVHLARRIETLPPAWTAR
jgi:phosphate transport system protein